ncbi:MAG: methylenetetrahydrofolate reductase [NAD(P)H] [Lachnospiraceae bacterium]|jgi:methylenetetrahydrofolate reductase (NADPH)|nr:methylenetetrahydrofolate reductase [NAD(P)H] [Lachnospiraceae bacterium]
MKIKEILNQKTPSISFEIFPPNARMSLNQVMSAAAAMSVQKPDFMSVTYGAAGGTKANTVKIASGLQEFLGIPSIAHLTCVATDKEQVKAIAVEMREAGIENVLALRGDVPEGAAYPSPDRFAHASELVKELRALGDFCIGGACYPEGHVEAKDREEDICYLKEKVDAGCDFLTTQMFFDNDLFRDYLYRIREKGILVPVLAGIMPVTNEAQIKRICSLSGAFLPKRFERLVERFGDRPEAMMQAGIAYAVEQIIDLIASGVSGIHIYTMNRPEVAARIRDSLSDIL